MVREILFKAKSTDGMGWVQGDLVTDGKESKNNLLWIFPDDAEEYDFGLLLKVIPETVCQYTGLKDKNGDKIFEGDEVLIVFEDLELERGVVSFMDGCFIIKEIEADGFCIIHSSVKLTGKNIHDEK